MTDTLERAPWLEPHDEFEGVGAHELNPRYTHVDGGGFDEAMRDGLTIAPRTFIRAQSLLATPTIRLDGADFAHYQFDAAPIDWIAYARACWFGMTKLTQSVRYLDPTADRSRKSMLAVGIDIRGVYHWLSSTTDPEEQAWWFLKCLGDAPTEFAALDDEEAGVNVDKTLGWLEVVEKARRRPSPVYSGAFVASGTIWTDPRIRESKYGMRPMMLAAYTSEARARSLPGVANHPWHSWQYSSSGPVPGITGRCDMNRVDDRRIFAIAAGITPAHTTTAPTTSAPAASQEHIVYISNADPRPATNSDPGHAWFELMAAGRLRIVTDINDVCAALGKDEAGCVAELSVRRPNTVIDALLGKGEWTDPAPTSTTTPAAPTAFRGTIEIAAV